MPIEIQYLGVVAEATGKTSELIDYNGSRAEMLNQVIKKYPGMKDLSFVVAQNGVITHAETKVMKGDKIALIPPAPGG
ncbi:MoaD/ThiS family protein [Bacteroidota bacterium]